MRLALKDDLLDSVFRALDHANHSRIQRSFLWKAPEVCHHPLAEKIAAFFQIIQGRKMLDLALPLGDHLKSDALYIVGQYRVDVVKLFQPGGEIQRIGLLCYG